LYEKVLLIAEELVPICRKTLNKTRIPGENITNQLYVRKHNLIKKNLLESIIIVYYYYNYYY